jgi:two-component system, OmpR family, KDP operon response regulator KdpE
VLLREVWGPSYETETNYLRVYLPQLRRKLVPHQATFARSTMRRSRSS